MYDPADGTRTVKVTALVARLMLPTLPPLAAFTSVTSEVSEVRAAFSASYCWASSGIDPTRMSL